MTMKMGIPHYSPSSNRASFAPFNPFNPNGAKPNFLVVKLSLMLLHSQLLLVESPVFLIQLLFAYACSSHQIFLVVALHVFLLVCSLNVRCLVKTDLR